MSRQIRWLGMAIVACYLLLFLRLNQIQVIEADDLNTRPGNTRIIQRDFNEPRGDVLSAEGAVLATSVERRAALRYQRTYPEGELFAGVTGFYSFTLGSDGVERTYNEELAGRTAQLRLRELSGFFSSTTSAGTVVLTLRKDVQTVARDALDGRTGAVVALDPRTGAVLAMYSNPTFDPNVVSSNDGELGRAAKELLDAAPGNPLRGGTYRERYFPGSTFKVVTAAAGLISGQVTVGSPSYPVVESYTPPGTSRAISNFGGRSCGGTLFTILARSCNTSFAQMAAEQLGPDPMIAAAEGFGFNGRAPIDLPGPVESVYPTDYGSVVSRPAGSAPVYEDTPKLAQTAIGQNDVAATPLQMALVAAGIGNGGVLMTPHVMAQINASDGSLVDQYEPGVWRTAATPEIATTVRQAMVGVVDDGTAAGMAIRGVEVGAKTGTAQLGTSPPTSHGWMIAFAGPPDQPAAVAVAVIIQGLPGASEATGATTAGPVAKAVLEAALRPPGG
jgi:penicillin-binding protein A